MLLILCSRFKSEVDVNGAATTTSVAFSFASAPSSASLVTSGNHTMPSVTESTYCSTWAGAHPVAWLVCCWQDYTCVGKGDMM